MKQIDRTGAHVYMSPQEIDQWYGKLEEEYLTYLSNFGVKLPKKGTAQALWLVYLRKFQGDLVHKDTISEFVQSVNKVLGKDQQVRHLGRMGWYVLNKGDKLPQIADRVPSGYHILITTENPKPSFLYQALKRAGRIAAKNFDQLKVVYDSRCATCGSPEGKPNFLEPAKITDLQQAHMDPSLPLDLNNTIPQCQVCNGVYQDDYVFDDKGRVTAVASARPVHRARLEVRERIRQELG